jgi:hypothetical protein
LRHLRPLVIVAHVQLDTGTGVEVDQPDPFGGDSVFGQRVQHLPVEQVAARRAR